MRTALVLAFTLFAVAGCDSVDTLKQGFEHSKAISKELEQSLGQKSFVGFNWHNGVLTSVSVNFEGIPKERSLSEICELAGNAVVKEFKQEPKQIVVSFAIKR